MSHLSLRYLVVSPVSTVILMVAIKPLETAIMSALMLQNGGDLDVMRFVQETVILMGVT